MGLEVVNVREASEDAARAMTFGEVVDRLAADGAPFVLVGGMTFAAFVTVDVGMAEALTSAAQRYARRQSRPRP